MSQGVRLRLHNLEEKVAELLGVSLDSAEPDGEPAGEDDLAALTERLDLLEAELDERTANLTRLLRVFYDNSPKKMQEALAEFFPDGEGSGT